MFVSVTRSMSRLIPAAAFAALVVGVSPAAVETSPSPPAEKAAPGEPGKARLTTLDVAGMDTGAQACTDFYQ